MLYSIGALRPFVTASLCLIALVLCTSLYLFHDEAAYHSTTRAQLVTMTEGYFESPEKVLDPPDISDVETKITFEVPPVGPGAKTGGYKEDGKGEKKNKDDKNVGYGNKGGLDYKSGWSKLAESGCPQSWEHLAKVGLKHELTESVLYARSCIQPIFSSEADPSEVANMTDPIFENAVELDLTKCSNVKVPECTPVKLEVPKPYPQETFAEFVFGVATSSERLRDSIAGFAHWLSGSRATLVAAVIDSADRSKEEMKELEAEMRAAGIDAHIVGSHSQDYIAHFAVLEDMIDYSGPETKWFGLLDDDTFYPSLKPLSDALAQLDHTTDVYAGTLSEDWDQVRIWGYMAYGGAGAFLSAPLANKLADHLYDCIAGSSAQQGDILIRECVYTRSKAKLTVVPRLYQVDFADDVSGFFEAGLRPLNLHHWKTWFDAPVVEMAQAADFCGDCFLQRWRFGNDTVLTNGYSIAIYRDGLKAVDLDTVEGTWHKYTHDFDWSIGPLRRPLSREEKQSFRLLEAEITPQGDLRQIYVWKGNNSIGELDEVVEMIWKR